MSSVAHARSRPFALLALLCASCAESSGPSGPTDPLTQLEPTGPLPLSPGNLLSDHPAILVARDGSLLAAWYSNRPGVPPISRERKEIFVARSTDGAIWSDPVAATFYAEWSSYPSLAQSADGVFHLAWTRTRYVPGGCVPGGSIPCRVENILLYNRSADGLHWTFADEIELTSGPADRRANVVATSDGRLLVYYDSRPSSGDPVQGIWVVAHRGAGWDAPAPLTGIESSLYHDDWSPNVVERAPGDFLMTWTRSDNVSWGDGSSQTMLSTSTDGIVWTAPVAASPSDATAGLFPHLYSDHARQNWFVVWWTDSGTVDLRVGDLGPPTPIDIPGGTPRVLPTATPGIYWATWAEGWAPTQVRYRFLAK